MADAEEVKLESFHKKSTSGKRTSAVENYDELADQKTPPADTAIVPQDEEKGLLWANFIKDYEASLFYGSKKFFHELADDLILVFNEDGFRVFDPSIESLEPVLKVEKDLLCLEGDDKYALLSYDNQYVLVSAGSENQPQEWCVEVHKISNGACICELRPSDVSADIPEQATASVSWVTNDCFTIYVFDEGANYAARFIFKVDPEECKADCVLRCPMQQVTDESPSFVYARVTPEAFVKRGTGRYGTPLAVGLVTKHSCWEMYAVQEGFRPLGAMCPFGNERNVKEVWNQSGRYVAFHYLDDVESNREICVYDFGADQNELKMRECFKAPMFPGESYDDVEFEFFRTATSTTVFLQCTAEEKGEVIVYDLGKSEGKNDAQRRMSMAAVEQKLANMRILHLQNVTSKGDEGKSYGGFGNIPFDDDSDLSVLSVMYDQMPKKFYVLTTHDQTCVSVYDIENEWKLIVDNYSPFGQEKFQTSFESVGAVLATTNVVNPSQIAACLLLPLADPVKETRQRLQLIDLAHAGRVLRNETLEYHEAFLTQRHSYVVARFHLNFTIFDVVTSRFKRIPDWDPEGGEVASNEIVREVSPDDRFLAVGARNQIRIFNLSMQAGIEPVAILDYTETCKELKFTSCMPVEYPPPSHAYKWDHLYFEDGGRMWVRFEEEGNHFVPLHKIHESRKQLIHLSKTLMLAVLPLPDYDWEQQNAEGESLEVLRVDLGLQNVLDISTVGSWVEKIGDSQRIIITNKKSLRVLDFTIADRLVDSISFFQDSVIANVISTEVSGTEMCVVVTADPLSRSTQQVSMVKMLRTGPELVTMPNGGTRFAPFGDKKFKVEFLPSSYRAEYMMLISVADEVSLYSLSSFGMTTVDSVQNYVLPAKFDDSVSEKDSWVEITTVKGVQMINLNAVLEEGYNPRDDWLPINTSRGFRSLADNRHYVLRDKSASVSIYEFKEGERPKEVLAINRVCDTENKMGAPEIDIDASDDGRFLMVKNCYTFSADTCFILIYDLKTLSKVPILRRNYGQATHTNFSVFFPSGSCMHLVICTPGGKSVEVYDLLACARQEGKGDVKPIFTVNVENNDFLKLMSSRRVSLDNVNDDDDDDKKSNNGEEKTLEELLAELTDDKPKEKKPPPPPAGSSSSSSNVEPLTQDQKTSRSIFWVSQKSNSTLSFYYITATESVKLLRSIRVFDRQEVDVDFNWPYIYLTPLPKKNDCKVIKITETKEGKLEMDSRFDFYPTVQGYSEIKNVDFREMDGETYLKLVNSSGLYVFLLGERAKKIYDLMGDTLRLQFDFIRGNTRATVFTTGTPNGFIVDLATLETVNILPTSRRNEKITQISTYGDQMTVYTMHSVLLFNYKEKEGELRHALTLTAEFDIDPTWPNGSWEFNLKFDDKLAVIRRTDFCSCMCIYRNVRILDGQTTTTKWPLVDVPIDQKTDPEWSNANISFVHDYIWCHSPAKKGFLIVDLSRLLVAWYPLITWSSTENILKYDLERYSEEMPHIDHFLRLYQDILVGPMSPKDPLSAVNHLCTSSHDAISDGRHRALQLFLLHMPQGAFELNPTEVPPGENYPRPRRTALGALIAKKDWVSVSMLLDFLVIAHMQQSLVPLSDRCLEFGFELVDLAYQHSPQRAARFLKDFALQKLPMKSAVVQDAMRSLKGVRFGNAKYFTAGTQTREPNNLWSGKFKNAAEGGDRFQVCYVAIPGMSSDKSEAYPVPMFHQLVQVAQDTQCAELIANPGIEAVIDFKWNTFARSRFLVNFGLHLIVTFCVILFCSFLPLQDKNATLLEVASTSEGSLCIAMLSFFFCYGAYNIWKEGRELLVQGPRNYLGVWNLAANLQSSLLISTAVLYLERSAHTHFLAGATVLICHIYILFYLQALETTGPLIRMILQITSDMKYFTGVLVLCLIACTFFYIVVTEGTGMGAGNVAEVWLRMYMTFFFFNFDSSAIDGLGTQEQITVSYLMIVGGSMFVAIVLLNLLIALMGDSFATIKARDTMELQLLRAGMIRDIEFTMTIKTAGIVKERFPLWVHCLLPIKEAPIREVNETLSELRKLRSDVAKLEEKFHHLALSGGAAGGSGGGAAQRRRFSTAASVRGSVAGGGGGEERESQSLEALLKSLEDSGNEQPAT